jgi:hypothetical protein
MQGVEDGQRGRGGEAIDKKNSIHESAVHICIVAHVCSHLMNIVFRL